MALVSYDSSDCSDNEDDSDIPKSSANLEIGSKNSQEHIGETAEITQNINPESASLGRSLLFSSLPPPRSQLAQTHIPETDDDAVPVPNKKEGKWGETKEVKPVKIVIPSLSELADDEPPNKKPRISNKGKGLFSVLPPPKHSSGKITNRLLLPYSLKSKATPSKIPLKKTPLKDQSKKSVMDSAKTADDSDDEDDDMTETHDFFSLESVGKIPDVDVTFSGVDGPSASIVSDANPVESAREPVLPNVPENFNQEANNTPGFMNEVSNFEASSSSGPSTDISSMMSDEGFLRLGGTKKRGQQDIQFIDVSQADQLPSSEEWMRKTLKEETGYRPSRKKGFMPTAQQRRKHQITYLAFQAKEREMELQEQWAQNRFTKHQTQSKYGF